MNYKTVRIEIRGTVCGPIWAGDVCTKEFAEKYDRTAGVRGINCLRQALQDIIKDGDFQKCTIECAYLTVIRQSAKSSTIRMRTVLLQGNDGNFCYYTNKKRH